MKVQWLIMFRLAAALAVLTLIFPPGPALSSQAPDEESQAKPLDWTAPDQQAAMERAKEKVGFVDTVVDECLLCRQQKLRDMGLGVKDITHSYFLLDSPVIKEREDQYGPVRFMHSKHAAATKDCALCHHYRPADPKAPETVRCSACHQESFNPDHPERIGLKAAYHQQCMACHKEQGKGPVDCSGCHEKQVPDHGKLVKLGPDPKPWEGTEECLRCRGRQGYRKDGPLALERAVDLYPGSSKGGHARQGDNRRQQLLSQPHQQRGSLHKLPHRIRLERQLL